ncbi:MULTISPECIES: ABC transporter substrate-binding protein [unclassified Fusibacter]|uniref:substrate-binding periplasmic protein n=1 Tax=unclassified Fusibacter TaxID=2624464 RepID=UPI00101142BB|nr:MULTISPECIES: transporter substrate-binding domain-containing protein [unclassified Fusibacter]MCK8061497.1 transporter substrate-binding domain-containing protein [Fusibacter sp. A2]NPE23682.1 amino acid ABC transporter substrate-binding protein [Fusibacter sp. A1]RXV58860.1 hypothetical protein DWB64_18010 [Fusibacter sp. A1]
MKKIAKILVMVALLMQIGCQSSTSVTQPNDPEPQKPSEGLQPLKVAIIDDTAPYADVVDGEYEGLIIDIVSVAFSRMDVEYEFVDMPFNRIMTLMEEGGLDIATDIFINPKREEFLYFPVDTPLAIYPYALFKRSDKEITYDGNPESLTAYIIGTVRGYYLGSFDKYLEDPDYTIIESKSPELNMKQLYNGRVDLAIEVLSTGESLVEKLGYGLEIEPLPTTLGANSSYVAFSKPLGLEPLMVEYQKTIKEMYADGTLQAIYDRYGLPVPDGNFE